MPLLQRHGVCITTKLTKRGSGRTWNEVEGAEFTSDKQFSVDNGGRKALGGEAARASVDGKRITEWTLNVSEMAKSLF